MNSTLKSIYAANRKEWHEWLLKHHDSENEVWLIYYKRHTCKPRVEYNDAVEEALCFGWIDSIIKRIDENSYCQKFTPRRRGSKWSESNVKRAKHLIETGAMTEAGMKSYNDLLANPSLMPKPATPKEMIELPADLVKGLKGKGMAYNIFMGFSPSYRANTIGWINAAKRPETRQRRIREVVELTSRGKKTGLK